MNDGKKFTFFKKSIVKNILWILAVTVGGFILWSITFLLDALFQGVIRRFFGLLTPSGPEMGAGYGYIWFPAMMHFSFLILICLISWPIFKSRLGTLYKAIYSTVPLAVIFVTIGMFLYQWPVLVYIIGGLFGINILYYLYRTKQSWIYYFAVIFTGIILAIFTLLGGEI
ncbi:MAG: hypothetical protein ACP5OA_02860 [Candidatus Woesearchaeota archaeon]